MSVSLPRLTLYLISIVLNVGIIVYVRRNYDRTNETLWFSLFTGSVLGLSATDLAKSVTTVPDFKLLFFLSRWVFKWSIALSLLVFALYYTNNSDKLSSTRLTVLSFLGVSGTFIALTNPIHHLMWDKFNKVNRAGGINATPKLLFHIQLALIYLLIAWAVVLLTLQLVRSRRSTSDQLIIFVFGMVIASAAHLSQSYNILPNYGSGYAVATVLATGGAAYGLFYADLLKNKPVTLNQIFSSVGEGIIVTTSDWRVADYNARAAEILGNLSYGQDIQENQQEIFNDTVPKDTVTIGDIDPSKYLIRTSDLQSPGGGLQGYIITLQDVTRVQKAEQQLQHESNQLDTFTSFISHDLRNPLSVAKLYTEELEKDIDDDRIQPIIDSLNRMNQMIDDGLTFAREGRTINEKEFSSFDTLAKQAWQTSHTPNAAIEINCKDEKLYCNKSRVRTLLENLYRNAAEHSDSNVTVTVGILSDHSGFYVEDTGPGIPDNVDPFEQGVTTQDEGTGLGLSIVDSIVSAHGWEIHQVESESEGARLEICNVIIKSPSK